MLFYKRCLKRYNFALFHFSTLYYVLVTKYCMFFRSTTQSPPLGTGTSASVPSSNFFITPISPGGGDANQLISSSSYDPCAVTEACGPNAKCSPRGSEPVCSCPVGFSGIPRDGVPDPAHGCVRTPQKCSEEIPGKMFKHLFVT